MRVEYIERSCTNRIGFLVLAAAFLMLSRTASAPPGGMLPCSLVSRVPFTSDHAMFLPPAYSSMKEQDRKLDCDFPDGLAEHELSVSDDKVAELPAASSEKQDPFGDESDAGVKYKTLAWW